METKTTNQESSKGINFTTKFINISSRFDVVEIINPEGDLSLIFIAQINKFDSYELEIITDKLDFQFPSLGVIESITIPKGVTENNAFKALKYFLDFCQFNASSMESLISWTNRTRLIQTELNEFNEDFTDDLVEFYTEEQIQYKTAAFIERWEDHVVSVEELELTDVTSEMKENFRKIHDLIVDLDKTVN